MASLSIPCVDSPALETQKSSAIMLASKLHTWTIQDGFSAAAQIHNPGGGCRCLGGKDAALLLCRGPEPLDSLHRPKPPCSGVSFPNSTSSFKIPRQAGRGCCTGGFASIPWYPGCDSHAGVSHRGAPVPWF